MVRISAHGGDESRGEVAALFATVYPPEVLASVPWRDIQSSSSELRILKGRLRGCHCWAHPRDALYDGRPVSICGVGGVATHPSMRRMGLGRAAMMQAHTVGIDMY